jgi:ferredoxin
VDPLFVAKALIAGADGVLVSGCHPRDCHYSDGNYYARRRLEVLKEFLPVTGIDPARFEYTWVSASEGARWRNVVTNFTDVVRKLGPAPRLDELSPCSMDSFASPSPAPVRALGWDAAQQGRSLADLKEKIKAALPELDLVIGWEQGYDAAHGTPLFMRVPEDVDRLTFGPLSVQNPANFLPELKDKKVGIVVKGCDSKSIVELLQEKLIERGNVKIFAMSCGGVVNQDGLPAHFDGRMPQSVTVEGEIARIEVDGEAREIPFMKIAAEKCLKCVVPDGLINDVFVGSKCSASMGVPSEAMPLESLSLADRMNFWRNRMERCIRCYACRNACPMCVCRSHCIAETRDPHWVSQDDSASSKLLFQIIHALHLAGRCTACGECQRVCPVQIPVGLLKEQVSGVIKKLFAYGAGADLETIPPLLTFKTEEQTIPDRG